MERMPSPPRARCSFCQPLSRPRRADGWLALIWATTPRHDAHWRARQATDDATTDTWGVGGKELAAVSLAWVDREPCHAEMGDTHAARGRRLLQAARTCHLIIF
ncbi:hypothetical protein GQ55_4G067600 [Panicum hallii var. hallii]|jgi:hypothetical protein|uniref:Uncharacterized protein n=2 Tax=Panicum hallii TaxID=206008 RepID=A0A2T7DVZ8_9POAL|nr:hypothetical protein GQ55_4G067600 [Panicum hallii var. hallii]PVH47447.1 hypothetical protein PAHAL_4G066100 [Panicum hallii]